MIVFGLVDFGLALQEVQFVSDAARYGARSASSESFFNASEGEAPKLCLDGNDYSCENAPFNIEPNDSINAVAIKSACNHLSNSRVQKEFWEVEAEVNGPINEGIGAIQSSLVMVTLSVKRKDSKSCFFCLDGIFDGSLEGIKTSFPLEKDCVF